MKSPSWKQAMGLGAELVIIIGALLYAGQYVDVKYELPGYGTTFGGLFGLIIWLTHVVMLVKRAERDEKVSSQPPQ